MCGWKPLQHHEIQLKSFVNLVWWIARRRRFQFQAVRTEFSNIWSTYSWLELVTVFFKIPKIVLRRISA